MPITVAVDANGADLGPAEVAAGAAIAAAAGGPRRCCSAPPARSARCADGVEVVDAPVSIAKARRPRARRARERPTPRSSGPRAPSPRATPTRSSAAARPAPRWPPALFNIKRAPRHPPPGAGGARARPRARRSLLLDVGANVEVRPEHLVQFALHGRRVLAQVVLGVERPRVGLLSNGEEAEQGHAARRRGARRAARPPGRGRHLRLRRQRRGHRRHGRARPTWSSPTASPATSR